MKKKENKNKNKVERKRNRFFFLLFALHFIMCCFNIASLQCQGCDLHILCGYMICVFGVWFSGGFHELCDLGSRSSICLTAFWRHFGLFIGDLDIDCGIWKHQTNWFFFH